MSKAMTLPPQVEGAIARLNGAGFRAYVVGGAVRDFARGLPSAQDWDIATSARPEEMKALFSDLRLIETGLKHGTLTVLWDGLPLEITTFRVDGPYTDHRRPDRVDFTRSLADDLARRDFTVNALAYHPQEGIVDLVGGLADLEAGLLRCVGEPERRFREDPLRILRGLRFAAALGLQLEGHTAAALVDCAPLLDSIAPERILVEVNKLLCGQWAGDILRAYPQVLAVPIPQIAPMVGFEQSSPYHHLDVWGHTVAVVEHVPPTPVLRWAALLHDMGKPHCFTLDDRGVGHFYGHGEVSVQLGREVLTRLRMDTATREAVLTLVALHDRPIPPERKSLRRLLAKVGEKTLRDLISLHRGDVMGQPPHLRHRLEELDRADVLLDAILKEESCFSLKHLALNGRDMMSLGLSGREVGEALAACLAAVVEEEADNTPQSLRDYLARRGRLP